MLLGRLLSSSRYRHFSSHFAFPVHCCPGRPIILFSLLPNDRTAAVASLSCESYVGGQRVFASSGPSATCAAGLAFTLRFQAPTYFLNAAGNALVGTVFLFDTHNHAFANKLLGEEV